jgi:outer membrane murein-binding lipoprotein Lpp
LAQDSTKIDELSITVNKLKADVEYLRRVNDKLKKQQTAAKTAPKQAATTAKKK